MNDSIMQGYLKLYELTYGFLSEMLQNTEKASGFFDYVEAWRKTVNKDIFLECLEKHMSEMKETVMDFYYSCCETNCLDDFATFFAMYCNHYIKYGLSCLIEDTENTMFWLEKADFSENPEFLSYLEEIYNGIRTQIYSHFEKAIEICPKYSVAHLYLFVKSAVNYFYLFDVSDSEEEIKRQKDEMMEYYKKLPFEYAKYALSSGKYYMIGLKIQTGSAEVSMDIENVDYNGHGSDLNALPHLMFKSRFRIFAEELVRRFTAFKASVKDKSNFFDLFEFFRGVNAMSIELKENKYFPFVEDNEKWREDENMTTRTDFLHICNLIQPNNDHKVLEELLSTALNLEKARRDRAEVIQDFSHTYKNMRATQLYNIAEALMKMDDKTLKDYGRAILLEYGIKQDLTKAVEMLQLKFDDKSEELLNRIRKSMSSDKSGYNIKNILDESLKRCLITLFHDGSDNGKRFRKAFIQSERGFDLISMRNDFENDILFQENKDVVSWFSENVFPVETEFPEDWLNLSFEKENYSAIILTDILSELAANIFKYGDKTKSCHFIFESSEKTFSLTAENCIDPIMSELHGTQKGLFSMEKTIDMLNHAVGFREKSMNFSKENNLFCVTVSLNKTIFCQE